MLYAGHFINPECPCGVSNSAGLRCSECYSKCYSENTNQLINKKLKKAKTLWCPWGVKVKTLKKDFESQRKFSCNNYSESSASPRGLTNSICMFDFDFICFWAYFWLVCLNNLTHLSNRTIFCSGKKKKKRSEREHSVFMGEIKMGGMCVKKKKRGKAGWSRKEVLLQNVSDVRGWRAKGHLLLGVAVRSEKGQCPLFHLTHSQEHTHASHTKS